MKRQLNNRDWTSGNHTFGGVRRNSSSSSPRVYIPRPEGTWVYTPGLQPFA